MCEAKEELGNQGYYKLSKTAWCYFVMWHILNVTMLNLNHCIAVIITDILIASIII